MNNNNSVVQQIPQPSPSAGIAVNKKKKKIILFSCIGAALVLIAGGIFGYKLYQHNEEEKALNQLIDQTINVDTYYNGISVQGIDLGGKTREEAKKLVSAVEPSLRDPINITISSGENNFSLTQNDFDFTYNTDKILEEAYALGRTGDSKSRYRQVLDLEQNPRDFSISHSLNSDSGKLQTIIDKAEQAFNTAPVDATVSDFQPFAKEKFTYTEGTDGNKIDSDDLMSKLKSVLSSDKKEGKIEVISTLIPYNIKVADLKATTQKISSFSTYSNNTEDATHNMSLALASANGKILQPGEVFSFNGTTGDTTTGALGYRKAGAIANNTHVEAYGGGICQAATTIYGAALRADLEIVERYNHRWLSTYVPIGQDATVDYPSTDFQFRNSSSHPIYIAAWTNGRTLNVELYGYQPEQWDTIEVNSWQTEYIDPPADITTLDPNLAPGTRELVNNGSCAGHKASGEKIFYKNGSVVKKEAIFSSYYKEGAAEYRVGPPAAASPVVTPPADTNSSTPSTSSASSTPQNNPSSGSSKPAQ